MKRPFVVATAVLAALGLALSACSSQPAASPPTQAPAAPKAAEPTKAPAAAPAAQPTPAPASKKVDWPVKGKPITMIVPFAAGSASDIGARLLSTGLEKELGTSFQVVNKAGANGQLGMTDLAQAKSDGNTFAYIALSSVVTHYSDPEVKPTYYRKDIMPVAEHVIDVRALSVSAKGPYKTLQDLVDAAKSAPNKVKAAGLGVLSDTHITTIWLEKLTGAKITMVQFGGGSQAIPALMGGQVDMYNGSTSELIPMVKSGELRVLGVMSKSESKFLPGVKTMEAQGYPILYGTRRAIFAPAGTPKEIVDTMTTAIKKVMDSPAHKDKVEGEMGLQLAYLDPAQLDAAWTDEESVMKEFITMVRQK